MVLPANPPKSQYEKRGLLFAEKWAKKTILKSLLCMTWGWIGNINNFIQYFVLIFVPFIHYMCLCHNQNTFEMMWIVLRHFVGKEKRGSKIERVLKGLFVKYIIETCRVKTFIWCLTGKYKLFLMKDIYRVLSVLI